MHAFPLPNPPSSSTKTSPKTLDRRSRARGRERADEAVETAHRLLAERREQLRRERELDAIRAVR